MLTPLLASLQCFVTYCTAHVLCVQVAAGAFVSRDRDSALKQMIYLAASRYDPAQESASTTPDGLHRFPGSQLRKISLTQVRA